MKKEIKGETITNEAFFTKVAAILHDRKHTRNKRPSPEPGYKYRKDWMDRLEGRLSAPYFVTEMHKIWEKKSDLPYIERMIITEICNEAIRNLNPLKEQKRI